MDFEKLLEYCLFLLKFVGFNLNDGHSIPGFLLRFWSIFLSIILFLSSIFGFHFVLNNINDLESIVETFAGCSNFFLIMVRLHVFISNTEIFECLIEDLRKITRDGEINNEFLLIKF
jgi:hypothetical protein